jgi:uncharacterized protein
MYDNGFCVERDLTQAAKWHEQAAYNGDVYSRYRYAGMCYNGIGVERNFEKAFQWYEDAAKQGYVYAQYSLALMYFNGQGVAQNDVAAYAWMSLASAKGDKVATDQLKAIKTRMSSEQVARAEAMVKELNQLVYF